MGFSKQDMDAIANRFFDAVTRGDIKAVGDCYAEDIHVWHARDGADTTKKQNLDLLTVFFNTSKERHYDVMSRKFVDDGFIQEHVCWGVKTDGSKFSVPVGFFCTVNDKGLITRIAEYNNASQSPMKDFHQEDGFKK
jgi:ketosteroid isomerase-like protein